MFNNFKICLNKLIINNQNHNKMTKKAEVKRNYIFSDATSMKLTDTTISNGRRDIAELASQGVTTTRLDALEEKNEAFRDMEDDIEWAGLLSEKVALKDEAFDVCETGTRNIRRMAANIFGEDSPTYRRFGFDGINGLKDLERAKAYFRIWRRATAKAAELAPEGLTAVVLSTFKDNCIAADTANDVVVDTVEARDEATEDRIELGNEIYAEVVKICNTGKTYWFDKVEAKYNDYVITDSGTTAGGSNTPILGKVEGNKIFNAISKSNPKWVVGVSVKIKNTTPTAEPSPLNFYTAKNPGDGWMGMGEQLYSGQEATHTFTAAEMNDCLNIQNMGPNPQTFEISIL